MRIEQIKLKNFRNYLEQEIVLDKNINLFYGENGAGKTNIIEAIYLSAIGKSFRTKKDKEMIQFEKKEANIEMNYQKSDRTGNIRIFIEEHKNILLNHIKLNKLSDILGNINIVLFHPNDILMLKNGPQERRKFLDIIICQLKPGYVYYLKQYLKTLEQRNYYLRQIKYENKNAQLLDIWDEKLIEFGKVIYEYRKEFIEKIKNKINTIHQKVSAEILEIKYDSHFEDKKILENLQKERKNDIEKGYTKLGVHRDDFEINMNHKNVSMYGSQGQNRSVILSLKLTELEIVQEEINEYPILLLDDFMSELDENRRRGFLEQIKNNQVIITCTDKIKTEGMLQKEFFVKGGSINGK